jgi:hypothetical protein
MLKSGGTKHYTTLNQHCCLAEGTETLYFFNNVQVYRVEYDAAESKVVVIPHPERAPLASNVRGVEAGLRVIRVVDGQVAQERVILDSHTCLIFHTERVYVSRDYLLAEPIMCAQQGATALIASTRFVEKSGRSARPLVVLTVSHGSILRFDHVCTVDDELDVDISPVGVRALSIIPEVGIELIDTRLWRYVYKFDVTDGFHNVPPAVFRARSHDSVPDQFTPSWFYRNRFGWYCFSARGTCTRLTHGESEWKVLPIGRHDPELSSPGRSFPQPSEVLWSWVSCVDANGHFLFFGRQSPGRWTTASCLPEMLPIGGPGPDMLLSPKHNNAKALTALSKVSGGSSSSKKGGSGKIKPFVVPASTMRPRTRQQQDEEQEESDAKKLRLDETGLRPASQKGMPIMAHPAIRVERVSAPGSGLAQFNRHLSDTPPCWVQNLALDSDKVQEAEEDET